MRHPKATPLRGVFCGAKAVSLRPSLGAAASLEGRYGFQKLFEAIGDGNLTVIADVIETSSECQDFLKAIAGIPLIEIMRNVIETTTQHILALAGADQDQANSEPHSGETMPFSEYYKRLYQLGTGWLGWSPSVTWQSTPSEIYGPTAHTSNNSKRSTAWRATNKSSVLLLTPPLPLTALDSLGSRQ